MSTGFARDYAMRGRIAATRDGHAARRSASTCIADHGAFNATAQPSRYPAGFFSVFTGSYDLEAAHCRVTGVYTNKAPGGVAYACSFRIAEAVYLVERCVDCLARELGVDPVAAAAAQPAAPRPVPVRVQDRLGLRLRRLRARAAQGARASPATTSCAREQAREARARRADGHRRRRSSPRRSAPGPRKHMDMFGLGMNDGAALRMSPDRQGAARDQRADPGPGPRDDVRADRRRGARDPARGRRRRPRRHRHDALRARARTARARRR